MASLIDRLNGKDVPEESPGIDLQQFRGVLAVYANGQLSSADIKAAYNMDAGQQAELDEILAQFDAATVKVDWIEEFIGIMHAGYANGTVGLPGFETSADARSKLGLA